MYRQKDSCHSSCIRRIAPPCTWFVLYRIPRLPWNRPADCWELRWCTNQVCKCCGRLVCQCHPASRRHCHSRRTFGVCSRLSMRQSTRPSLRVRARQRTHRSCMKQFYTDHSVRTAHSRCNQQRRFPRHRSCRCCCYSILPRLPCHRFQTTNPKKTTTLVSFWDRPNRPRKPSRSPSNPLQSKPFDACPNRHRAMRKLSITVLRSSRR